MNFQFGRISLIPETRVHREPVFDVVMIGHTDKDIDVKYLFTNSSMLNGIRDAGYQTSLDKISGEATKPDNALALSQAIYNLPIPIRSLEEFQLLFSIEKNQDKKVRYNSRLGGDYAWLPIAVADFFQADVMQIPRRLWVIVVNEVLGVDAFVALDVKKTFDLEDDTALARALALPDAGLLLMPDFERLHISQSIRHIPALRIANPLPAFLPCGTNTDDGVLETNTIAKLKPEETDNFLLHLKKILKLIASYRADITLLMTFPYDKKMDGELPRLSQKSEQELLSWRQDSDRSLLRHVQLIYPYMQDTQGKLSSPCGILAGKILSSATVNGSWRSIAGIDLHTFKRPFPNLSIKEIHHLRENIGLAVMAQHNGRVQLDDEKLSVAYVDAMPSTNSGELARFMGWLMRSLEKLGLDLIFEAEALVLKSDIILQNFFGRLYQMGALRGKNAETAFSVKSYLDGQGKVIVDIEIAPALAIDQLILDFRLENGAIQNLEVRRD